MTPAHHWSYPQVVARTRPAHRDALGAALAIALLGPGVISLRMCAANADAQPHQEAVQPWARP